MADEEKVIAEETPAVEEKKAESMIPKHRFDEVNERYREYKDLGLSPADIVEMVTEYRHLVEKADTPAKKEPKIDEARRKELRDGLREIAPEIDEIIGLKDELKKTKVTASAAEQQQLEIMNDRAKRETAKMFADSGFDTVKQKALLTATEDIIANDIYTNPEKRKRFFRGDLSVVRETYAEYEANVLAHVVKPAKQPTKDLSFLSGKQGLTVPASKLDDKVRSGQPLTRDEQRQMHDETFALIQGGGR